MTDHVPAPAGAWFFLLIISYFSFFVTIQNPIRRMQFCMALNSYHFFKNIQKNSLTQFHHCAIMDSALLCGAMLICHA